MIHSWTLPLKGETSTLVKLEPRTKRRYQKKFVKSDSENTLKRAQAEINMLKTYHREALQEVIRLDMENRKLRNHVSELSQTLEQNGACSLEVNLKLTAFREFSSILLSSTSRHASKLAKRRIRADILSQCPQEVLSTIATSFETPFFALAASTP